MNLDTSLIGICLLLHQKVGNALLVCIRNICEILPSGVIFPILCSKGVQAPQGSLGKWWLRFSFMPSQHNINSFHLSQWGILKSTMSNVNEQLERKKPFVDVPNKKKMIDGKKPIPKGKKLITEEGGSK